MPLNKETKPNLHVGIWYFYSEEKMDIETDSIIVKLNLANIYIYIISRKNSIRSHYDYKYISILLRALIWIKKNPKDFNRNSSDPTWKIIWIQPDNGDGHDAN